MLHSGQPNDFSGMDGDGMDKNGNVDTGQPNDTHRVELVGVLTAGRKQFLGVCTCGERSDLFITAGMVWGWETQHGEMM